MKTAKVFKWGHSQASRLPKEFCLSADEVKIRREGNSIVPPPKSSILWQHVRACLGKFKGDIERQQPT